MNRKVNGSDKYKLINFIKNSKSIIFFGGAGVSTESGIPDFRSETGLYTARRVYGHSPEELLSYSLFIKNPKLFFLYYRENLIAPEAKPNAAHIALAEMEGKGLLQTIITQNVDGLHQAAGSNSVLELHGSNWRHYCLSCDEKYSLEYILDDSKCKEGIIPICEKCGGIVRPDVVLYQESLDHSIIEASIKAISNADLLIVGGTSLAVYPAAGLLQYFHGNSLVLINKSETTIDRNSNVIIRESIGKVLSTVVKAL